MVTATSTRIQSEDVFTRSTCYRRNVNKDATSRFGSNENIFPICQSFEAFDLVDSKCFQIKFITNKIFFTGRCHFQLSNIRITKRFWLAGNDDYLRGATSINHQVALRANFKMYSRSAKGGEKGDPNRNHWLAKMHMSMISQTQWRIYTQRKKLSTPMFFWNDKWYDKYHEITDQIISRRQW